MDVKMNIDMVPCIYIISMHTIAIKRMLLMAKEILSYEKGHENRCIIFY